MDAHIKLEGNITEEDSYELTQLANFIEKECDVYVKLDKQAAQPEVKDSGLTIGLTIAGLALTGIQTLISVILYWESKQQKYSLFVSIGNKQITIDNIERKEADKILAELTKLTTTVTDEVEIKIVRK